MEPEGKSYVSVSDLARIYKEFGMNQAEPQNEIISHMQFVAKTLGSGSYDNL